MKFGKELLKVIDSCNPEWAPYWLDYKDLKHKIKHLEKKTSIFSIEIASDRKKMRRLLGSNDLERAFFDSLNTYLKQTSVLYVSEMKNLEVRFHRLKYHVTALQDVTENKNLPACGRALQACVQVYKDAVDLEKFVVTQYDGFNKILKKHDKCTSFITRSPYMENVVNRDEFARHDRLAQLIEEILAIYDMLDNMNTQLSLLNEVERISVDALLGLHLPSTDAAYSNEEEEESAQGSASDSTSLDFISSDGSNHDSRETANLTTNLT